MAGNCEARAADDEKFANVYVSAAVQSVKNGRGGGECVTMPATLRREVKYSQRIMRNGKMMTRKSVFGGGGGKTGDDMKSGTGGKLRFWDDDELQLEFIFLRKSWTARPVWA